MIHTDENLGQENLKVTDFFFATDFQVTPSGRLRSFESQILNENKINHSELTYFLQEADIFCFIHFRFFSLHRISEMLGSPPFSQ